MSDANQSAELLIASILNEILGSSPILRRTLLLAQELAKDDCPILIVGETGTGKENLARLVHAASGRPGRFTAFNCAAVTLELADAELFGHSKGAFTSATGPRPGLIADSDRGTLFLDEVEELPMALQAKLLRVLEERAVRPVGADREQALDLRIVSASNEDLELAVRGGRFRQDLYNRLAGYVLHVPPLRVRGPDILLLARHFLLELKGGRPRSLTHEAQEILRAYDWPGNVRELKRLMRKLRYEGQGSRIGGEEVLAALNLKRPPQVISLSTRILEALDVEAGLDIGGLEATLRQCRAVIYRTLEGLVGAGQVRRIRQGRRVRYCLGRAGRVEPGGLGEGGQDLAGQTDLIGILRPAGEDPALEVEDQVLALAARGVKRADLMAQLGMPPRTASRLLARLEEAGRLEVRGAGRYRTYWLAGEE